MDTLLLTAASGMKARMESLDMLANNIANSGTSGFKADREFYSLMQDQLPVIERQWTDFSQGALTPTANPLDLGLTGPGFFALNSAAGVVYTRNGQFQVGKSNLPGKGQLQTLEGYTLRNVLGDATTKGQPILVDPALPIGIGKNGEVQQGGQVVGQIEVVGPDTGSGTGPGTGPGTGSAAKSGADSGPIDKLGNSYFRMSAAATPSAAPKNTEVMQGALEQSNVPAGDAMVRLVSVMRQFEMLQKAVGIGADMDKQAITDVARVV
jgi:flagellar basal-body rod protein FlgF